MKIELIHPKELSKQHLAVWREIQLGDNALSSPFFCPEYVGAVATFRDDVRIAVIEMDGRTAGFFPFQVGRGRIARPVGTRICDISGIIGLRDTACDVVALVRKCGLAAWNYRNVSTWQYLLHSKNNATEPAAYIDLSHGFDAYCKERRLAGSSLIQEVERKSRKLEREVGPLRFCFNAGDSSAYERLRAWKSEQRRKTYTIDVMRSAWVTEILDRIRQIETPYFAGQVATLYAGDQLAAVHFGMRSHNVLHYWFPTYNHALHKYSPGSILLHEMAKAAPSKRIKRIDLGGGDETYKDRFKSGVIQLAAGSAASTITGQLVGPLWFQMRAWSRNPTVQPIVRSAKQLVRRAYYFAADLGISGSRHAAERVQEVQGAD